jgi:hypothetical protein
MTSLRRTGLLLLAAALLGGVDRLAAQPRPNGLGGRVITEATPLGAAGVYAYQLADLSIHKVSTDAKGNFLFQDLPAGLYKIIAHKPGFVPAVILLTRTTAQAYQFLELQLAQPPRGATSVSSDDDFWALRAKIPGDVLRDILASEAPMIAGQPSDASGLRALGLKTTLASNLHTSVQALTGVDQLAQIGMGQISAGRLGIDGSVGEVGVGLKGNFTQLNSDGFISRPGTADAQASALSLDLQAGPGSHISVTSTSDHMVPRTDSGLTPVDFEHYGVTWSQAIGETSHSEIAAQYTSQNNFSRQATIDPIDIPGASRTWRLDGSYTTSWSDSSTLQAGIKYREDQLGLGSSPTPVGTVLNPAPTGTPLLGLTAQQDLDFFTRGGTRVAPALLVEYGLYNTLRDGSVALMPEGGVVLELSDGWQMRTAASHRAYESAGILPEFVPAVFKDTEICTEGARSCYQFELSHQLAGDGSISIAAVQRTVGNTLRFYFNDDFFERLESLYLVPGDKVPEVRLSITEHLTPQILATAETTIANGGGGTFISNDGSPYHDRVEYIVSSIDTRFLKTGTGVFLALHHVRQGLAPLGEQQPLAVTASQFDRLQLLLSQNLNMLFNLGAEWAIQLNMELSHDQAPYLTSTDRELHRSLVGGLSVKF